MARAENGRIIGAGAARPLHKGVAEIAGIGVVSDHRGRGAGAAVTALLARESISRGADFVWLSPGSAEAERIYVRAGFVCASEQLHISKTLS